MGRYIGNGFGSFYATVSPIYTDINPILIRAGFGESLLYVDVYIGVDTNTLGIFSSDNPLKYPIKLTKSYKHPSFCWILGFI